MDVNKKIRFNPGIGLVLLLSFIPMFAWKIGLTLPYDTEWQNIAFIFAKIGAFGGMAMFALSLILSGRYSWYERLFGGLDKMYVAHRFLGTFSLILLFIHPVSLSVLASQGGISSSLSLWFKVSDFGVWLGAMALYLLLGLILWSIFARAKYETFIMIHRLLGVTFILGAVHAFMSGSILASNAFMYWYLLVLTLAGSVTFILYSVLGDVLHRPLKYKLVRVAKHAHDIIEVELKPMHRIMSFAPGQFAYVNFEALSGHGYHPFSISSNKRSANLTMAIRKVGDFTNELQHLKKGSTVRVKGPYGGFILQLNPKRKQLWIAGGIGVTPFLCGASSLRHSTRVAHADIEMVYATADRKPFGIDALQAIEERNDVFNVTLLHKDIFGHISFDMIASQIKDLKERDIFICGPPPMLSALRAEAEKGGFSHRLHYEEFSY